MRVAVLGGGPAGLYFSILLKRSRPGADILVVERNRADDTFGFGVVFSDQTLEAFERADPESHRAIVERFAYWQDVEIRVRGTRHRIGGNGFCGCSRRTLLLLLQDRARSLGVRLEFRREASLAEFDGYDLVVAADGINSAVREAYRDHFRPSVDLRPNRFAWMGSTKELDAFTFSFRQTEWGTFIAHAYQYEPHRSTWVMETDPATHARAGLAEMDEAASARFLEGVFADDLAGHGLVTNRSLWRQFPMIRCARYSMGRLVLLGDAKATAHFSIGSGTKLAMEDAIALHAQVAAHGEDVPAALEAFDRARRDEVERTQHAADVSLVWFEHVDRFLSMPPVQFAFGLMTRSKSITYDNLRLRAPGFVDQVDRMFADGVAAGGHGPGNAAQETGPDVLPTAAPGVAPVMARPVPPMFQPFRLRGMELSNRVVVSPMCMYSADEGVPNDWHLVHYAARALGGAGLVFTEMTDVSPEARITPGCAGVYTDAQEAAWKRIVDFVHARTRAKLCLQLGHAGRKGATRLMWEGMDRPLPSGGWPTLAPSPLPYYPDGPPPRAMTRADMDRVVADFRQATERAARVGFDMVELHCAHGYLLATFLSPLTNRRTDGYGGTVENRLRFPLEVWDAVRLAWPADRPAGVRISASDWAEGGLAEADVMRIVEAFRGRGCDLIDVSSGQTVHDARAVYGRMYQVPFSDAIRNEAHMATMCVGNITTADQVNTILAAGRADLVALGRPHLTDPNFTLRAAAEYGVALPGPPQYGPGYAQVQKVAKQAREEVEELRRKARPKGYEPARQGQAAAE